MKLCYERTCFEIDQLVVFTAPGDGMSFSCETVSLGRSQVAMFRSKISVPSRAGKGNSASQCSQRSQITMRFLPQEERISLAGHFHPAFGSAQLRAGLR